MRKLWTSLLATLLAFTMLCGAWAEELPAAQDVEMEEYVPVETPEELDEFELGEGDLGEEGVDAEYESAMADEFSQFSDIEWGTEGTVDPDAAGADTPAMGNVTIGDYTYSFDSGTATIKKYSGNASNLTLPTTVSYDGISYRVTSVGPQAFDSKTTLQSVTIPSCITQLGWGVFRWCTNLRSVTINGDLADCHHYSMDSTGSYFSVFYAAGQNTSGITVTFGNGVTRVPAYLFAAGGDKADARYAKVTKLVLPDTVTSIGHGAFYNCCDLTQIKWSKNLEAIGDNAFEGAAISELTLPEKVTSLGYKTFAHCMYLKSVTLPASLKKLETNTFAYCTNLTFLAINSNIEDCHGNPFYRMGQNTNGTTVTFGNGISRIPKDIFATGGAKTDGNYAKITTVNLPKTIKEIGENAFLNCYDISKVYFDGSKFGFDRIVIGRGNDCLINAKKTFRYLSGWQHDSKGWWYAREDGSYPRSAFEYIDGAWYFFEETGYMVTGWRKIGNIYYYFTSDGTMATGWQWIGGKYYYFFDSGEMVTGWQQLGGKWYYFQSGGAMATGWQKIYGKWYYFQSGGAMVTGWQRIGRNYYYFQSGGAMATGWQTIGGKQYYLQADGAMATDWQKISGRWYYFQSSGAMATGWLKISRSYYYFQSGGAMVTGWQKISGSQYYFLPNGIMVTGWQKISGSWYYFQSSGAMKTGWMRSGNNWYYFHSRTGKMLTGSWWINNRHYYFSNNGVLLY